MSLLCENVIPDKREAQDTRGHVKRSCYGLEIIRFSRKSLSRESSFYSREATSQVAMLAWIFDLRRNSYEEVCAVLMGKEEIFNF